MGWIEVFENGSLVVKYVVIFGGGFDFDDVIKGINFYIVDVEIGKYIYKCELFSLVGVFSVVFFEFVVVDIDGDVLIDMIYIGMIGGFMFKVDFLILIVFSLGFNLLLQDLILDFFVIFLIGG